VSNADDYLTSDTYFRYSGDGIQLSASDNRESVADRIQHSYRFFASRPKHEPGRSYLRNPDNRGRVFVYSEINRQLHVTAGSGQ